MNITVHAPLPAGTWVRLCGPVGDEIVTYRESLLDRDCSSASFTGVEAILGGREDVIVVIDLPEESQRLKATDDGPRPWPRAQRMPAAIVGGFVQPWYLLAVAEYDEARGEVTVPNSTIPGGFTAAQVNRAIDWWNGRAESLRA
jgi:hypothetical protein